MGRGLKGQRWGKKIFSIMQGGGQRPHPSNSPRPIAIPTHNLQINNSFFFSFFPFEATVSVSL